MIGSEHSSNVLGACALLFLLLFVPNSSNVNTSSSQQKSGVLASCCIDATSKLSHTNSNSIFSRPPYCNYHSLVNLNKKIMQRKPHPLRLLKENMTLSMVSYCTIEILDYSTVSYVINSAYAEHRGYDIELYSSMVDAVYESRDHRWNRVKLMHDLLSSSNPYDYYVWFDADLIFQNFSFRFEDIIAQYSNASIIISAERHAETGVANTGCFIVKNTSWSLSFMGHWWNDFDRSANHDQIFFDVLYKSMLPDVSEHIVILPSNILNSTPPPMFYQSINDSILHLMGMPSVIRKSVFEVGLSEICNAYRMGSFPENLKTQLSLSKMVLQDIAIDFYRSDIDEGTQSLFQIMRSFNLSEVGNLTFYRNSLSSMTAMRESVIQLRSINRMRETNYISSAHSQEDLSLTVFSVIIYRISKNVLDTMKDCMKNKRNLTGEYLQLFIEFLNLNAIVGNDVIGELPDADNSRDTFNKLLVDILGVDRMNFFEEFHLNTDKISLLHDIESVLIVLSQLVSPDSLMPIKEMIALNYHSIGMYYFRVGNSTEALNFVTKCVDLFDKEIQTSGGNMYHVIVPLLTLGSLHCSLGDTNHGLKYLYRLMSLMRDVLLIAESQMKKEHIYQVALYFQLGICLCQLDNFSLAQSFYQSGRNIYCAHEDRGKYPEIEESYRKLHRMLFSGAQEPVIFESQICLREAFVLPNWDNEIQMIGIVILESSDSLVTMSNQFAQKKKKYYRHRKSR